MKQQVSAFLDRFISSYLLLIAGVTPLLFLNLTTEFFDTPKLLFLAISVFVLYLLWALSWVLKGKVVVSRTPLDIPMLLFLAAILTSTFFSIARFVSIFGHLH